MLRILEQAAVVHHRDGIILAGPAPHFDGLELEFIRELVGEKVQVRSVDSHPVTCLVITVERGAELLSLLLQANLEELGGGPWEVRVP